MLIYCRECEHGCSEAAEACPECGHPLKAPQAQPVPPPVVALVARPEKQFQSILTAQSETRKSKRIEKAKRKAQMAGITCKVCNIDDNFMIAARGPCANALVVALGVFLVGGLITLTIIGAIIGVPMMLVSLFMGNGPKVWKCKQCKAIVPRG